MSCSRVSSLEKEHEVESGQGWRFQDRKATRKRRRGGRPASLQDTGKGRWPQPWPPPPLPVPIPLSPFISAPEEAQGAGEPALEVGPEGGQVAQPGSVGT